MRPIAIVFVSPEVSLEIGDGPATPGAAYCAMHLRVGGLGITCDIASFWFRDDLRALAPLVELWATASMDDPAVGVTFWLYYEEDDELERALAGVEATEATLAE